MSADVTYDVTSAVLGLSTRFHPRHAFFGTQCLEPHKTVCNNCLKNVDLEPCQAHCRRLLLSWSQLKGTFMIDSRLSYRMRMTNMRTIWTEIVVQFVSSHSEIGQVSVIPIIYFPLTSLCPIVIPECSHEFCFDCILTWIGQHKFFEVDAATQQLCQIDQSSGRRCPLW